MILKLNNFTNNRTSRRTKGLLKSYIFEKAYILYFSILAVYLNCSYNLKLLKRFPNWDYFFIDSITNSQIQKIRENLNSLDFNSYNFLQGLGLNDIYNPYSINLLNPLHLILLSSKNNADYVYIRTTISLTLLGIGFYKLLSGSEKNINLRLFLSSFAMTLPVVWSMEYINLAGFSFLCSVPLIIYSCKKYFQSGNSKHLVVLTMLIITIGPDLVTAIKIVFLMMAFCISQFTTARSKIQIYRLFKIIAVPIVSMLTFILQFASLWFENRIEVSNLGIKTENLTSLYGYARNFFFYGAQSLIYPIEGSLILIYLPVTLYFIMYFIIIRQGKNPLNISPSWHAYAKLVFVYSILPIFFYIFPLTSNYLPSYFRYHFNSALLIVFLTISTAITETELNRKYFLISGFFGLLVEIIFFIINPFEILGKKYPKYSFLVNVLGTHKGIYESSFKEHNRGLYLKITENLWEQLIFVNLVLLIFIYLFTRHNSKNRFSCSVLSMIILFSIVYSSTHWELRRYTNMWQQSSADNYRSENFFKRYNYWEKKFNLTNSNYRLLPVGNDVFGIGSGRNAKLIADPEMTMIYHIPSLFQYRDVDSALLRYRYSELVCKRCIAVRNNILHSYHPPTVEQVTSHIQWLNRMSVKYLVVADGELPGNKFKLLSQYRYPSKIGYDQTESGTVRLYEYKSPNSILGIEHGKSNLHILRFGADSIEFNFNNTKNLNVYANLKFHKNIYAMQNGIKLKITKNLDGSFEIINAKPNCNIIISYEDKLLKIELIIQVLLLIILLSRKKFKNDPKHYTNFE